MSSEALRLVDIEKRFSNFKLQIKELVMERGYVLGLIGQNGAGKSTTLRILMNLIYPDRGSAWVLGLKQPDSSMEIKRRVGYVSENPRFYEDITVRFMANLVSRYYPSWDKDLYHSYLEKFTLEENKKIRQLSRGMKVKLALTLALSHRPELLILDEPTSGIDPIVRQELLDEIAQIIADENRAVVFSSHITQDVEQIADYVAIINGGTIAEYSDKESLLERYKKVSGTISDEKQLHGLFKTYTSSGHSFVGITDRYSTAWKGDLKSRGASGLKVVNIDLNEILFSIAERR